jgi:predicted KAP-like P-loop ATPase
MASKKKASKKTSDFTADRPIASSKADRLGRTQFAEALAERIRAWNGSESLVISLCGEWGCGKTSLKNMVLESLNKERHAKVDILQFNPWEISGHASVAGVFFRELSAAINRHSDNEPAAKDAVRRLNLYSKIATFGGSSLKTIGKAMPLLGVPGGPLAEALGEFATNSSELAAQAAEAQEGISPEHSLAEVKRLLATDMSKLKNPLLVVIDDIDRLTTNEIREVFQLVKANADFPNLIYLLMFDREIVAGALNSVSGDRGHEFLDKIIQVLFHVPQPSIKRVHKVLFEGLDAHLAEAGVGERWELQRWGHVWPSGLSHYFANLRCVYRFLGSFSFQVSQMRNGKTFELNPLDLIILETLRLFEPTLYEALPMRREILTGTRITGIFGDEEKKKAQITEQTALLSLISESRRNALNEILEALFPALYDHQYPDDQKMQRQLRVGHKDYFDRYFAMSLEPDDVPQADLDALRENFANPLAFLALCKSLKSRGLLASAFERLDAYKQDYPVTVFPNLITTLTQAGDILPKKDDRNFFYSDALTHAFRLVHFGLKKIEDENERYRHLRVGIQASTGVRLAVTLLSMEERRPNRSRSESEFLISENHWDLLKKLVVKRVTDAANEGRLKNLEGLSYILWRWKDWAGPRVVKKWLNAQLKTSEDALWILKVFLSTMQSSGEKVTYTRYLNLEQLSQFVNIATIKKLTLSYDITKLPQNDMRALRAFRQALIWKKEGNPANYMGDRGNDVNPLEEDS